MPVQKILPFKNGVVSFSFLMDIFIFNNMCNFEMSMFILFISESTLINMVKTKEKLPWYILLQVLAILVCFIDIKDCYFVTSLIEILLTILNPCSIHRTQIYSLFGLKIKSLHNAFSKRRFWPQKLVVFQPVSCNPLCSDVNWGKTEQVCAGCGKLAFAFRLLTALPTSSVVSPGPAQSPQSSVESCMSQLGLGIVSCIYFGLNN